MPVRPHREQNRLPISLMLSVQGVRCELAESTVCWRYDRRQDAAGYIGTLANVPWCAVMCRDGNQDRIGNPQFASARYMEIWFG